MLSGMYRQIHGVETSRLCFVILTSKNLIIFNFCKEILRLTSFAQDARGGDVFAQDAKGLGLFVHDAGECFFVKSVMAQGFSFKASKRWDYFCSMHGFRIYSFAYDANMWDNGL